MTLRQEAYAMIDDLDEDSLQTVIETIRSVKPDVAAKVERESLQKSQRAFERLEELRKQAYLYVPKDFDYEAARAEAMEEKYGRFT